MGRSKGSMCGTLKCRLHRWLLYALDLYPSVLSGYINLLPLPSLPNFTHCLLYYLSTADDRAKQIAQHVKHAHTVLNPQRSRDPYLVHAHQYHCKCHCDYDPIRGRSTAVLALFLCSHEHSTLTTKVHRTPARCLLAERNMGIK